MHDRGVTVHPADWMPLSVDDLPDVYAPSADWCDRADGNPVDTLNSEN